MKQIFLYLALLLTLAAPAQKLIKGVVVDAEKGKVIPSASVFLNNTSIGTTADAEGRFELTIPAGKYELIVSSIGYETYNNTISAQVQDFITIRLAVKAEQLETVVIEPYEKDGWETWGRFFLENFIGTSANAQDCKIKNTEVIRFRNSKKKNELTATALEPLIIENKALGYTIKYQLENFSYDFQNQYLLFSGYPFFEAMKGSEGKQKRWEKRRKETYEGSMMHFMRSVYRNTLAREGFEVRSLQRVPNNEKKRVKEASKNNRQRTTPDGKIMVSTINRDSTDYYDRVLRQEDYHEVIGKTVLPGDSIAYAADSVTAGLAFDNYLLVIYKNKVTPPEYRQQFPRSSTAIMSRLTLTNGRAIEIQANGSYYDPTELMTLGYWAWSEKMATMLPFDYTLKE
jgi:hypothetical protein